MLKIAQSMFYATRYDYLRVAKAIMDDWQNDECVGKVILFTIIELKRNLIQREVYFVLRKHI